MIEEGIDINAVRSKVHEIIDSISDKKLADIVDFLEYLKLKEEIEATEEIVSDEFLVQAVMKGLEQADLGETISFERIRENV